MALTRKMLKAMSIEDEKIDQIIEAHTETVDALKSQRDEYMEKAKGVTDMQRKLEELESVANDDFRTKYEKEHADFEAFKEQTKREKADGEKRSLYRQLLIDSGVDAKRVDAVLKVTDLDSIKVKDGQILDAEQVSEKVKADWPEFIRSQSTQGVQVATPPANTGGDGMTREKIMAIKDRTERRAAIASHMDLFGATPMTKE